MKNIKTFLEGTNILITQLKSQMITETKLKKIASDRYMFQMSKTGELHFLQQTTI